jgi:hypothetical protein
VLRPGGYVTIVDPDHPTVEQDTCGCGHCQRIIQTKAGSAATVYLIPTATPGQYREEAGAFCRVCMRPVCLPCHAQGTCAPWERQLEIAERRDRFLRAVGI